MDMVRDELGLVKTNLMDEPKRLELYDNRRHDLLFPLIAQLKTPIPL